MQSGIIKRSINIDGHKTSVSLEDEFWYGLKEIARAQGATLSKMIAEIDNARRQNNLSSALRLFVLNNAREHGMHLDSEMRSSAHPQTPAVSP